MPGGDRTGPGGGGPKTGRGLGDCTDNDQTGNDVSQPAWGSRRGGRWGGCGWRNGFNVGVGPRRGRGGFEVRPRSDDQDIAFIKTETQELRNALQQILDRLDKLDV